MKDYSDLSFKVIPSMLILFLCGCGTSETENSMMGEDISSGAEVRLTYPDTTSAGEMMAGEEAGMQASENAGIRAGEMVAGEMVAGEMTAGEMTAGEMTAGETAAGEMAAGEMAAGETAAGEMVAGDMAAGEMVAGDMAAGEMLGGQMVISCTEDNECQASSFCIEESCQEVSENEVDFCRLQWPLESMINVGENVLIYARVYEEGITDLTSQTDFSPLVIGEIGYRPQGSVLDEDFNWTSAYNNIDYDGQNEGNYEVNNDEYMVELTFDEVGEFEIAARFSVDYGQTWTLCDHGVDGAGSSDGYSTSHAGRLSVLTPCDEGTERAEDNTCVDIDECEVNNGGCDVNASCENNEGAPPTCNCNEGYEGDGISCSDINECLTDNGGCDSNATCENNIGLPVTCSCNQGFIGDGVACEAVQPKAVDYCTIQFPSESTLDVESLFEAYVRYYEAGITDRSSNNDEDQKVSIEFGYGPQDTDPRSSTMWTWDETVPTPDYDGGEGTNANNDEYRVQITLDTVGEYSYVFRVSVDREQTWVYCDNDGAGLNIDSDPDYGFSLDQMGSLNYTCPVGSELIGDQCVVAYNESEALSMIQESCSCHSPTGRNSGWYTDLPSGAINVSAGSFDYIVPGDYTQSYLWMKMTNAPGISGRRMPTSGSLPQNKIDQFAAYIQSLTP